MADYSPTSVTEMDVRNFTTPPLDYDDVTTAEILIKIESVETWAKRYFFDGGAIPSDGRIAVLLIIATNLLQNQDLARKYCTLASESYGDYSYTMAGPGGGAATSPFDIVKGWGQMGMDILYSLSASNKIQIRVANE